ncbi:MAG TPA: PD-(D/E)XK nuclease-like domain-containing protein [Planctomycetaceae bacterium]|nr:PD-(D/E)XK nuclease-like domain-containing protein [Planctomycetaceae bacterium]
METGFHNIPFEEYLGLQLVNSSAIKAGIEGSMKRMRAAVTGLLEDSDTKDRKFGRAEHCYILEGEEAFTGRVEIASSCTAIKKGDGMPCTNAGVCVNESGQWLCGVHSKGVDVSVPTEYVTQDELERIKRSCEAIRNHKCFKVLKAGGLPEVTAIADVFGVRCKTRMDFYRADDGLIIDLKKFDRTIVSVDNAWKVICNLSYHVQAELYRLAVESLTGKKPTFLWIFAESKPPYDVLPMQLSESDAASARAWIEMTLNDYAKCEREGFWPGIWDQGHPAKSSLPDWKLQQTPKLEGAEYDQYEPASGQQELAYAEDDEYPY